MSYRVKAGVRETRSLVTTETGQSKSNSRNPSSINITHWGKRRSGNIKRIERSLEEEHNSTINASHGKLLMKKFGRFQLFNVTITSPFNSTCLARSMSYFLDKYGC